MRTTVVAALAALVAVSHVAVAQTAGAPMPVADETARAAAEGRGLVASMKNAATLARLALERARERHAADEVRCTDEALSIADVTLRGAQDDLGRLLAAVAVHDARAWRGSLDRLRLRAATARDASSAPCSPTAPPPRLDETTVTVRVASWVPAVVASFPGGLAR